ncbi:hypothetical protein AC626_22520 [Pseudoalteromonas rubra]|uniref:Uncharacterized protein n=1 Tax=Pseudoalteromonas rubra TaxID=43658 RepID=A0A0L0EME9_9GAMM|nr:hypothetical protein AC626_22520 [Pseudoalteromonas rubra]
MALVNNLALINIASHLTLASQKIKNIKENLKIFHQNQKEDKNQFIINTLTTNDHEQKTVHNLLKNTFSFK